MAAGLGFKTFTTGEVLTAADVNGYLMQGVLVFATEAARNSAITSPQEGQFAFTKDTNSLWYYSGSAWVASGATGDIEGVTAGTGISGGGTSGTVTITNSMATAIDAKGDLVVGTGADTFARLAVGANDTVLVAASGEATGLKWAAPAAGAMSFITGAAFSGVTGFSLPASTFTATYLNYFILINLSDASATTNLNIRMRVGGADETGSNYNYRYFITDVSGATNNDGGTGTTSMVFAGTTTTDDRLAYPLYIFSPFATASTKIMGSFIGAYGGNPGAVLGMGLQHSATSFDSLSFFASSGNIDGSYKLYGIANS